MKKYSIADLKVCINSRYDRTLTQGKKYEEDFSEDPHMQIFIDDDRIQKLGEKFPGIKEENSEYILGSNSFSQEIIHHNGFVLHASAVVVDDKAYLFSASSGTGKSTHTSLWLDKFKDKAEILNDDKPAIRIIDKEVYVYGTPWSGKSNLNINRKVKLQAITFLEQSENNWIEEIKNEEAIALLLSGTTKSRKKENMIKLLNTIDTILKSEVKIFKMGCNISNEACEMAYAAMN